MPRLYFLECPVTDVIGTLAEVLGDAGTVAEVGDAAAEVGGAAAAGVGAADAAGAFGGADATSAGLDTGAAGADTGGVAAPSATSGLGSPVDPNAAGTAGGAGAATATLPEQTVTAASTAPGSVAAGGSATGGLIDSLAPVAGAGLLAGGAAGGGGAGVATPTSGALTANNTPAGITDTGQTLDSGQFLSANDAGPSLQSLSPDVAQSLGLSSPDASTGGFTDFDASNAAVDPASTGIDPNAPAAGAGSNGFGSELENFFKNPKNDATAGLLGISLMNALKKPKLPSQDQTASAAATAGVQGATSVIQSGGTATPEWASQKSSIDATIDQQIKQQSEAIQQAAANNGEGNQNSGIVQQQIAQMTQNANVQRQQLYAQAQQQNVQAALSELSGGDATLTAIGNTQLQQEEQAQALAAQTAEMALLLQSGGSVKIPGTSPTPMGT
jgi:hypothetical protein